MLFEAGAGFDTGAETPDDPVVPVVVVVVVLEFTLCADWIDWPLTTRSTRRFICLPEAVAFDATGFAFP